MTREELLRHCKYYKGEEENPFASFNGWSSELLFWNLESEFVDYSLKNDTFVAEWNPKCMPQYYREIIETIEQNNGVKFSQVQQSIVCYIICMVEKWMPYSVDVVLKY